MPHICPQNPSVRQGPTEPQFVMHTATFLADLKGIPWAEFELQVDANAKQFST